MDARPRHTTERLDEAIVLREEAAERRRRATPGTEPRWDPGTLEVRQTSEGPLGVGTTLAAVVDFMGRRTLGVRITTFAPNAER